MPRDEADDETAAELTPQSMKEKQQVSLLDVRQRIRREVHAKLPIGQASFFYRVFSALIHDEDPIAIRGDERFDLLAHGGCD